MNEKHNDIVRAHGNRIRQKQRGLSVVVFVLIFFLTGQTSAAPDRTGTQHFTVQTVQVEGLLSVPREELLYLLSLEPGKEAGKASIQAGIKRAFLKGVFEDIIVEEIDGSPGNIRVSVRERPIIDSITLSGNQHFSGRFIRRALGITPGDRMNSVGIRQGIARLKNEMSERGFASPEISYTVEELGKGRARINFIVSEGEPLIISKLIISEPGDDIASSMTLKEGDIYDRAALQKLAEKLTSRAKKDRRVGSSIKYSFQEGVLTISFTRGRKLAIDFSGNSGIGSRTLMKEVTFYEINEFNEELLDETIARMTRLYHRGGYAQARLAPVVTEQDETTELVIYVFEGRRFEVKEITFTGSSFPQEMLLDTLTMRPGEYYDPDAGDTDREGLENFYRSLGYADVKVQEPVVNLSEGEARLSFAVTEGLELSIGTIAVEGNLEVPESTLLSAVGLKSGDPFNELGLLQAQRRILDTYQRQGFLDSEVSVKRDIRDSRAEITFVIKEGKRTNFGKRVYIGNRITKDIVIDRELLHRDGMPADSNALVEERQQLYKTGLFSDIDISLFDRTDDTSDVIYRFTEAPAGIFEFGLGYEKYEKLRGYLGVTYTNLWGMNRQISLYTKLSKVEQRLRLAYTDPWFFGRDRPLKIITTYDKLDFWAGTADNVIYTVQGPAVSVGTERKFTRNLKGELYYDGSYYDMRSIKSDAVLSDLDSADLFVSALRPGLIYDTRDNPADPRSGTLAGATVKLASGLFMSEADFLKVTMNLNKYHPLGKRVVIALSGRAGLAQGWGKSSYLPIEERYFLGGSTSVRGYTPNTLGPKGAGGDPTGGNAFAMANVELRINVWGSLGVVAFLDAGNVWQKIGEMDFSLRYASGMGLRYNTPVGPLRLDYGIKLNRETGESRSEIYFSIGQAF